ncbi:unnamed protein product, partial [Nesidiocoris tenuis]
MFVSESPNTLFNRNLDNAQYFRYICIFSVFYFIFFRPQKWTDLSVLGLKIFVLPCRISTAK